MTPAEKRDRRQARHDLQNKFHRMMVRRHGLSSTGGQLTSSARILTDRYFKEALGPAARQIEERVLAEAKRRQEIHGDKSTESISANASEPEHVQRLWRSDGSQQAAVPPNTVREVLATLS